MLYSVADFSLLQQALVTYVMSLETDELNLCCYLEVVHIYLNCLQRGKKQLLAINSWSNILLHRTERICLSFSSRIWKYIVGLLIKSQALFSEVMHCLEHITVCYLIAVSHQGHYLTVWEQVFSMRLTCDLQGWKANEVGRSNQDERGLMLLKSSQSKINALTLLTSASHIYGKERVSKKQNIFPDMLNYFVYRSCMFI